MGPTRGLKITFSKAKKGHNNFWWQIYTQRPPLQSFIHLGQLFGLSLQPSQIQYHKGCPGRRLSCAHIFSTKMGGESMCFITLFQSPSSCALLGLDMKAKAFYVLLALLLIKIFNLPTFYYCKSIFG